MPRVKIPKRGPKGSRTRLLSCTNAMEMQVAILGGIQAKTVPCLGGY